MKALYFDDVPILFGGMWDDSDDNRVSRQVLLTTHFEHHADLPLNRFKVGDHPDADYPLTGKALEASTSKLTESRIGETIDALGWG